jgi:hypothetical protein
MEIGAIAVMNPAFLLTMGLSALALGVVTVWALRGSRRRVGGSGAMKVVEQAPKHLQCLMQMRQALDSSDLDYVRQNGGKHLAAVVRHERRRIALMFLAAIANDFEEALHMARVIAVLSPEVSSTHEYERLKLTVIFRCRYQLLRLRLMLGSRDLPQVAALGQMVTSMVTDLEAALAALGERSARAVQLAAQTER